MSLETSLVDIKLESTPTPKITEYYGEDTKISIIKNNLEKIKKDGDKITEVNSWEIFYTHFPVFHGRLAEFYPDAIIESAYIWYGIYRNIELYLCGHSNNVYAIDNEEYPEALWAPSKIVGPKNIFENIVEYIEKNDNNIPDKLTDGKNIFEILSSNIKDSVMNRYIAKSFLQWHDMIVYCTSTEEKDGIKKIFGVPILVIPSPNFGYGWYNLNHEGRYGDDSDIDYHPTDKTKYYEFDGKKIYRKIFI